MRATPWKNVLVLIAQGHPIPGQQLISLPGFAPTEPLEPSRLYAVGDNSITLEVVAVAGRLAAEACGEVDSIDWVTDSIDLHVEACFAVERELPPPLELRSFAWELGMQADFAAGLLAVETK